MAQGQYKNKAYPLRIDEVLMEKLKMIAKMEDRATNKQIERIIRTYVEAYEAEHGEIKLQSSSKVVEFHSKDEMKPFA